MANQNSNKGNPASHRMSNTRLKARRVESWNRAQRKHEANRKRQEAQEKANKELRKVGQPTAWQEATTARLARRAEERARKGEVA